MKTIRRLTVLAVLIYLVLGLTRFYEQRHFALARPAHVAAYLEKFEDIAKDEGENSGIPPAIILAVSGLESAWGDSELAREGFNFFGIKARNPNEPRYCLPTREFTGGRAHYIDACFRSYNHPRESFRDYVRLLSTDPRYRELFNYSSTDYRNWAEGLQRIGYATDPEYAKKIMRVVEQYGLHVKQ